MESFEYNANPSRVIFGSGSIKKLPDEVKRLNKSKPLLLSTPQQADQVKALEPILKDGGVDPAGLYSNATMHTPTHITDEALEYASKSGADCVISFGGGSTTGLGKAISVRTGLEHISIPTTYAGSEMTPILGETADGRKTTRTDKKILPGTVIYDVDFTMTLPESLSATSGVNAIAHAGIDNHMQCLKVANTNISEI
jgi:alcohol dehydrogenase class IV